MQHAVAITQTGHALVVEQMRIDTRSLRRDVGTHPHGPPGQLVDQLEGAQLEILPGAGQQRFEVFQHRRHDQFEAAAAKVVEHRAAQAFDACRLGGQASARYSGNSQFMRKASVGSGRSASRSGRRSESAHPKIE
jgi:hypothetical protein